MKFFYIQCSLAVMIAVNISVAQAGGFLDPSNSTNSTYSGNYRSTGSYFNNNRNTNNNSRTPISPRWFGSSNATNSAYPGNNRSTGSYFNNNRNANNNSRISVSPRMSLPFLKTHVTYIQTKEATLVNNGPKHTFVYVSQVSGKGRTPEEVLNQYQEKHQSMMDDGYGPPEIVGHHYFKRNAEKQVVQLRDKLEANPGYRYLIEYHTPAQREIYEHELRDLQWRELNESQLRGSSGYSR